MRRWPLLVTLAIALGAVAGCSTFDRVSEQIDEIREPVTAEWAASQTKVTEDDFQQSATLRGPDVKERIDGKGSYYRAHLRATVARNGAAQYQVYVATHLEGQWLNLNEAHDQDRIGLGVHKVSRKERCGEKGCVFYEHIAMPATRLYLDTRARDAIRLDVEGPGGAIHVVLPGAYVTGFLDRVARVEAAWKSTPDNRTAGSRVSYCEAKFAGNPAAMDFCTREARASYHRLTSARSRARQDSFTVEARRLEHCLKQHNGRYGVDWMMVEHCFQKSGDGSVPAAR